MVTKEKRTKRKEQAPLAVTEVAVEPEKRNVATTPEPQPAPSEGPQPAATEPEPKPESVEPESANPVGAQPETSEKPENEKPQPPAKPAVATAEEQPINEKEEINRLLEEGYSVKQIIELGFNRRTAYHYAKEKMKPENSAVVVTDQGNGKTRQEMLKLGSKDIIPPEAVLEVIHLPRNGDAVEVWRRGVLDGVGMLLLGARYAQLTAAGQAEIVKSQLDVMQEAKESGKDIAHEAAQQTAIHMVNYLDERLPKEETKPKEKADDSNVAGKMFAPMAEMLGKQMANILGRAFGGVAGGQVDTSQQVQMPQGWQYKTEGGKESQCLI